MDKKQNTGSRIQWGRMIKKLNPYTVQKGFRYLKHYGPKEFWIRLHERFEPEEVPYGPWYEAYVPDEAELNRQRRSRLDYEPLISVAVPAYRTPKLFLSQMLDSLLAQTYKNWELCIANGSPQDEDMREVLEEYSARDKRNYVSLLGVEEAQRLVESYTDQAISALEAFAGDTAFLRELAVSLATREK